MTQIQQTVFEKYQIRKSKKQKAQFAEYVKTTASENGLDVSVEKGSLGSKNIVVGNVEKAKVVFAAHYDTCPVLPFPNFITPKNFSVYLLYQFGIVALLFLAEFLIGFIFGFIASFLPESFPAESIAFLLSYLVLLFFFFMLMAGPANKHTANDNTSGVLTLLNIITSLNDEQKEKVAFVFFDLEEAGLIGSSSFASKHKKQMKNKLLINFDCVSDGKNIILALRKKAKPFTALLEEAFAGNDTFNVEVLSKGVFYPSDQANFNLGVGVAALKKSKRFGILYMDRIHTDKDTVFEEDNIEFLTESSIKLIEKL